MKQNLTYIAVVLDRSGSMDAVRKQTIDNFNEFVASQMRIPGEARLRLVQFDDEYKFMYDKPLDEVNKLNFDTFVPRGSTALYDAIGTMTDDLGNHLARMPEKNRPGKVIVLVLTDGYENASKNYTRGKVADMIQHQREKYNWLYMFMGATEDAVLVAQGLNIPMQNAIFTNITNAAAYKSSTASTANLMATYRSTGIFTGYTEADRTASAGNVTPPTKLAVDKDQSEQSS